MPSPRTVALVVVSLLAVVGAACGPTPTPTPAPRPATALTPTVPVGPAPVIAGLRCPVTGARWGDGYGPRGSGFHWGVDLFEPLATPAVAVVAGRVHDVPNEGAGGNVVYLTAPDGTVYQYAHLLDFTGGDRSVRAGEAVGRVGQTGNATAVHLHFEIRIGGMAGSRVDPAPTLRAAGC